MQQIDFFSQLNSDIKPKPKKFKVKFIEDDTSLHEDFVKDAVFDLFMEQNKHYVIFHDNIYYSPFKTKCIKLQ